MKVSIIIPAYNEEKHIKQCIESLLQQNYPDFEIIAVDDGSTDKTKDILNDFAGKKEIIFLKQNHLGPGHARNLGVSVSGGGILVFIDSDMIFSDHKFLMELVSPIVEGKAKGTFSKEEYVANWNSPIARFWQYNQGIFENKMIPKDYPVKAPIFRAILKSEFVKAAGFDADIGYTDDWTLSRKLGYESTLVEGAKYYHFNPETFKEVFIQASWIGKNEFIAGTLIRKIKSLIKYNIIFSLIKGVFISFKTKNYKYLFFQITYDFSIVSSLAISLFSKKKIK